MYVLKEINGKGYNPKTPYNMDEMKNGYLTNDMKRIAIYQYKGYAERIARELGNFEVIQIENNG
jgi:hypothetical protein